MDAEAAASAEEFVGVFVHSGGGFDAVGDEVFREVGEDVSAAAADVEDIGAFRVADDVAVFFFGGEAA